MKKIKISQYFGEDMDKSLWLTFWATLYLHTVKCTFPCKFHFRHCRKLYINLSLPWREGEVKEFLKSVKSNGKSKRCRSILCRCITWLVYTRGIILFNSERTLYIVNCHCRVWTHQHPSCQGRVALRPWSKISLAPSISP